MSQLKQLKHMDMAFCNIFIFSLSRFLNPSWARVPFLAWLGQNDTERYEWWHTRQLSGQTCHQQASCANTCMSCTMDPWEHKSRKSGYWGSKQRRCLKYLQNSSLNSKWDYSKEGEKRISQCNQHKSMKIKQAITNIFFHWDNPKN